MRAHEPAEAEEETKVEERMEAKFGVWRSRSGCGGLEVGARVGELVLKKDFDHHSVAGSMYCCKAT